MPLSLSLSFLFLNTFTIYKSTQKFGESWYDGEEMGHEKQYQPETPRC